MRRRHWRTPKVRRTLAAAGVVAILTAMSVLAAGPASATLRWYPPAGTWNGYIVFLSRACHDGNDGVPGGPCRPNYGCNSFNENTQSSDTAIRATSYSQRSDLLDRGYQVIIGDLTVGENIEDSNTYGANVHIPLHSNAKTETCTNATTSGHGTNVYYTSTRGKTCATWLRDRVGALSPGTSDQVLSNSTWAELTATNAPACYLEAEFHTWNSGVTWLKNEEAWAFRIGWAVDDFFGYP